MPLTTGGPDQRSQLPRSISPSQYFSMAFGCIVGVAWIVVFGDTVRVAGPGGTAIALAVGGAAVLLIALCYAEMAARRPAAGGELVFAYELGGPGLTFATGATLALIYTATCAFEAISIGQLIGLLFPSLEGPVLYRRLNTDVHLGSLLVGGACCIGFLALNLAGTRATVGAQKWVTATRILLIGLFFTVALLYARPRNLLPLVSGATGSLKFASVMAVLGMAPFWYGGFNVVATASEEAATSMRQAGRALIAAIIAAGLFYIGLVLAIGALVPRAELVTMAMPAADAFSRAMGTPVIADLVLITAVLGNLTAWNALLMAGSRVLFALARARLAPPALAHLNGRGSPVTAIVTISAATALGLLLGRGFVLPLVNIASAAFGVTYCVTCLALLRLRKVEASVRADFHVSGGTVLIKTAILCSIAIVILALLQPLLGHPDRIPPEWITIAAWIAISLGLWQSSRRTARAITAEERHALLIGRTAETDRRRR